MLEQIQFIGTTPSDLIRQFKDEVIPQLKAELSKEFQPKQPTEYLTRNEVCELLKIDLSTLHRWTKAGKLQAMGMGNRIFYTRTQIDEKLQNSKL